ncbi:hypothetical protein EON65_23840 [archaeon]|nr:MAG: hypothetical protein EON65_23840 [archaeon]
MHKKEIILTYFLIGDAVQENKDFYFHDGLSIQDSNGGKLEIWKGDCVLVKIADGENGHRVCAVLVKGFVEQKVKKKKIKMRLTWFYNKEDLSGIADVKSSPEVSSIRRKEVFLSDHDDIINVTSINCICTVLFLPPKMKSLPPLPASSTMLEHVYFCRYFISTLKKKKTIASVDSDLVDKYQRFLVEVGEGKSGDEELRRRIPQAVLNYLTFGENTSAFFGELKSMHVKSMFGKGKPTEGSLKKAVTNIPPPPPFVTTVESLILPHLYSVPVYFEETQTILVEEQQGVGEGMATGEGARVTEGMEMVGGEGEGAVSDGVRWGGNAFVHETVKEGTSSGKRPLPEQVGKADERGKNPSKKLRMEETIVIEKETMEMETMEEETIEKERAEEVGLVQLPVPSIQQDTTINKKRLVVASPPIFSPRQHITQKPRKLERGSIDETRLRETYCSP